RRQGARRLRLRAPKWAFCRASTAKPMQAARRIAAPRPEAIAPGLVHRGRGGGMSGELDAAGDLANAGLIAGAITSPEPGQAGEGACLNCGAPLNGARFCSNCGQAAHANRSLWALVEELAWNVFNLDTKAWRTVPRLVVRPGTLTRSYIDGKRARYLTPLATFLLCYFFMFLVFSAV